MNPRESIPREPYPPGPRPRGGAPTGRMVLLALGTFLAALPVRASDPDPSWAEAVAREEALGLAAMSRGRYAAAVEPLGRAIEAAVRGAASGAQRDRAAASAEALLLLLDHVVRRADAWREAEEFLTGWIERGDLPPLVEARVRFLRARAIAARGGPADGWSLPELGFVSDWRLVGPFDNERGGGFERRFGPEQGIDLDAVYRGKTGEVGWRRLPDTGSGYVPLERLVYPSDQVLACLATTIHVPEPTRAAFRLGSGESVRVFVNGREVFSRDVRRSCALDQDAFGVELPAGRSHVLVKVGCQDEGFAFVLRITDPAGRSLPSLSVDASREAFVEPRAPEEAGPCDVDGGAVAFFDATLEDAAELRRAAWFHLLLAPDDAKEFTARDLASRAVKLAPGDPHARFVLALSSSLPIKMRPELEENERRRHLEAVLALDPGHAEAALELARHYLVAIDIPDRALGLCDRALATHPGFVEARIARAGILAAKGLRGHADAELAVLAGPDFARSVEAQLATARRLEQQNRLDAAVERVEHALAIDRRSTAARDLLLRLEQSRGLHARARELLDEELRREPRSPGLLAARARVHRAEEDLPAAREDLAAALELAPDHAGLLKSLAVVQHELGRQEAALDAFEAARAIDPADRWVENYVEFLERETRPFEDAFPLDVEPLLARAKAWETPSDEAFRYLLDRKVVKVHPDGTASRYYQTLIQIRNRAGASALARIPIPYLPGSQRARLRTAIVRKADGRELRGEMARGRGGARVVQLPVLEPGDVIELAYRVDDVRASVFGDYFGMVATLQRPDGAAVLESRFTLVTPEDREFVIRERNGAPDPQFRSGDEPGWTARTWTRRELPRIEREPFMPPIEDRVPLVEVTTYRDWNEFSRWWWNLIEDEFLVSDTMRELVEEIRREADSPLERIRRVYNYVAREIRYVAWEFGIHGYQPYNATTIFARRFGDCKDKSILMSTLLAELGIESHPVLIELAELRGEEDLSTALLNHFNHCILYVPGVDPDDPGADPEEAPGLFLDGTAQFHDFRTLPSADRGASVLIVDEGRSRVAETPEADPAGHRIVFDEKVTVRPNGSAVIRGTVTAHGEAAAQLRGLYQNPGSRDEQVLRRFTALFGAVTVRRIEFGDLSDLDVPVTYSFEIEVPDFLKETGADSTIPIFFTAPSLSDFTELPERDHDLLLPTLNSWESTVELDIRPPLRVRLSIDDVEIENDHARFEREIEQDGNRVVVRARFATLARRIPAEDYPEFRAFSRAVDSAARDVIRVR